MQLGVRNGLQGNDGNSDDNDDQVSINEASYYYFFALISLVNH